MMPSLFVAHGAPLLAMEDNEYTRFLTRLVRQPESERLAVRVT